MKIINYLLIIILILGLMSCEDGPPIIPGLTKSNVVILTSPDSASIYLNNKQSDIFSPAVLDDLEPGFYKIDLTKNTYLDTSIYFLIYRDKVDTLFVELREDPIDWWKIYNSSNSSIPTNMIGKIRIDKNNNKWITTKSYGLLKFDDLNFTVYNTGNSALPSNSINDIFIDNSGLLWLATDNGFCSFDGISGWVHYNSSNSGIPDDFTTCIIQDSRNNIWIGTNTGGLVKFDGVDFIFYDYSNSPLPSNTISSLANDEDELWIGTWGEGIAVFNGAEWKKYNAFFSNLLGNLISVIFVDSQGNKWIGSSDSPEFGGLSKFDDVVFTNYHPFNSGLPGIRVTDITSDIKNRIWVTTENGLVYYDGIRWVEFNISNSGLPDNSTISIAIDLAENKWISTLGLAKYIGGK